MYTPKEMKTIVNNCTDIGELTKSVGIFKQLFNEKLINEYYKRSLTLFIDKRLDSL